LVTDPPDDFTGYHPVDRERILGEAAHVVARWASLATV